MVASGNVWVVWLCSEHCMEYMGSHRTICEKRFRLEWRANWDVPKLGKYSIHCHSVSSQLFYGWERYCTYYILLCDKVCQWLAPLRSVVFSRYSGFLHQKNWPPRYNWNVVESGVKYHKLDHKSTYYIALVLPSSLSNGYVTISIQHTLSGSG